MPATAAGIRCTALDKRTSIRVRQRCGLLSLGVLVALLCCTRPGFADSATFNVLTTDGKSDPVAGVARAFGVNGTSAVSSRVYVKYRAMSERRTGMIDRDLAIQPFWQLGPQALRKRIQRRDLFGAIAKPTVPRSLSPSLTR